MSPLPFALLWARTLFTEGLTPWEIIFGRSPPICPKPGSDLNAEVSNLPYSNQCRHHKELRTDCTHYSSTCVACCLSNHMTTNPGGLVWMERPSRCDPDYPNCSQGQWHQALNSSLPGQIGLQSRSPRDDNPPRKDF